jgi:radical SAM protein with 4Fe4S-binding SPASM domain
MIDSIGLIAKPWSYKLEMTHGCNLACEFCPVHAWSPEKRKQRLFLSPELCREFAIQAKAVAPDRRIEMGMRGEPTLNPHLLTNLAILRAAMPRAQQLIVTNGVEFLKNPRLAVEILKAGCNFIALDCYHDTFGRYLRLLANVVVGKGIEIYDFRGTYNRRKLVRTDVRPSGRQFNEFSPWQRHPNGHKKKAIFLIPDMGQRDESDTFGQRSITNMAGNVDFETAGPMGAKKIVEPLAKKCVHPFRELTVTWNGQILICCYDWGEDYVFGNIKETTLREFWWGEKHLEVLRTLYRKDRAALKPCDVCDNPGGFRIGFLRNPFPEGGDDE